MAATMASTENRQVFLKEDSETILDTVLAANELFSHVKSTQEAALDAKLLLHAAHLTSERAQKLKVESGSFDLDDFIRKLRDRLAGDSSSASQQRTLADEGSLAFDSFTSEVLQTSVRMPCLSFM